MPMGDLVGPQAAGTVGHAPLGFEGRVAAAVIDQVGLAGRDGPVFLNASLEGHHRRMPRVARHKFFDIGHDHPYGAAGCLGEPEAQMAVHEPALAAKVPADGGGIDPYLTGGQVDAFRQLLAHLKGHLAVHPGLHPATVVQKDHRGMGLGVGLGLVVGPESMLEDEIGLGEALLHVALFPGGVARDVGMLLSAVGDPRVAGEIRMKDWHAGLHRIRRV